MIDHDELKQAADDADPVFLEVADQITERLQAGEEIDIRYYVRRYPQWAGAICELLPGSCAPNSLAGIPITARPLLPSCVCNA